MLDVARHTIIPAIVGIANERTVHLMLPVSFFTVRHVVPHGKCIMEKSITHMAVLYVHPLDISRVFRAKNDSNSSILPLHM